MVRNFAGGESLLYQAPRTRHYNLLFHTLSSGFPKYFHDVSKI
uniref:Uncharacterized protein n=1 Tax=Enterococcus faecalis TaxID=1351 RepID=Q8VT39_ENTFL|nr:unknown [Enterococcus faecalis]